jgi:GWxTD domain-containing protein
MAFCATQSRTIEPSVTAGSAESLPSRHAKWLNEDVAYIIDETERAAFLRLRNDEERDEFVEQFWLRRDPTPNTKTNEFREEHYHRISYANEHFASMRPGWQTDRGYIFIVYGPPDEIESHPRKNDGIHSGGPSPQFTSEVWLYRHIDGIGENATVTFIDRTDSGNWRVSPGTGK